MKNLQEKFPGPSNPETGQVLIPVLNKISVNRPASLAERLRVAGLAALTLVGSSEAAQAQDLGSEITETERMVAESVLGPKNLELIEGLGFEVSVPIEAAGNDPYIFFIGQYHTNPGSGLESLHYHETVADYQSRLYELLPLVTRGGDLPVFSEGLPAGADLTSQREIVFGRQAALDDLLAQSILTLADADAVRDYLNWYQRYAGNTFVIFGINSEDIQTLQQQYRNFLESYDPVDDAEEIDLELHQGMLGNSVNFGGFINSALQAHDTEIKLFMEEKIVLEGTEEEEINQLAHEVAASRGEAQRAYDEVELNAWKNDSEILRIRGEIESYLDRAEDDSLTAEEESALEELRTQVRARIEAITEESRQNSPEGRALREAEARYEEIVFTQREEVALRAIAEASDDYQASVVLLYGNAHNFAEELQRLNTENGEGEIDRGLIEIRPRDFD